MHVERPKIFIIIGIDIDRRSDKMQWYIPCIRIVTINLCRYVDGDRLIDDHCHLVVVHEQGYIVVPIVWSNKSVLSGTINIVTTQCIRVLGWPFERRASISTFFTDESHTSSFPRWRTHRHRNPRGLCRSTSHAVNINNVQSHSRRTSRPNVLHRYYAQRFVRRCSLVERCKVSR